MLTCIGNKVYLVKFIGCLNLADCSKEKRGQRNCNPKTILPVILRHNVLKTKYSKAYNSYIIYYSIKPLAQNCSFAVTYQESSCRRFKKIAILIEGWIQARLKESEETQRHFFFSRATAVCKVQIFWERRKSWKKNLIFVNVTNWFQKKCDFFFKFSGLCTISEL